MVAKTFERFLRYETGLGYMDFYNIHTLEEGEKILKELFEKWIKLENPTEPWKMVAKWRIKELGYEI